MKTKIININDPHSLVHAIDVLRNKGVIAFPTDTVYGIASLVFDTITIDKLYTIKGRNQTKAIAVLLGSVEDLDIVSQQIGDVGKKLAKKFWPGPLTLIVPKHEKIPKNLSPLPTIGVRIPDHPFVLKLLKKTGPLAVTSANPSGGENPNSAQQVAETLDKKIHLIIDGGETKGGVPSTVLDLTQSPIQIVRHGPISEKALSRYIY